MSGILVAYSHVTRRTGSAASFIIMMLPPKSGRKAVRLRNASVLSGLSYLYSHLTSLWLSAGEPFDMSREKGTLEEREWPQDLREKFIYIAEQLQDLRMRTVMSKWEGNIRGAWPFEDYMKMVEVQNDMLSSLVLVSWTAGMECRQRSLTRTVQVAGALVNLDPEMRKSTLPHTYVLNPHFVRTSSVRPFQTPRQCSADDSNRSATSSRRSSSSRRHSARASRCTRRSSRTSRTGCTTTAATRTSPGQRRARARTPRRARRSGRRSRTTSTCRTRPPSSASCSCLM